MHYKVKNFWRHYLHCVINGKNHNTKKVIDIIEEN